MMYAFRTLVAAVTVAFAAAPAIAAIDPNDTGAGTKLGIQELNLSGQVGEMTLFELGSKTVVELHVDGVPGGRQEPALIARGKDCSSFDTSQGFSLAPTKGGRSRTLVHAVQSKLLSGNYVVVVYTQDRAKTPVACGSLYQ